MSLLTLIRQGIHDAGPLPVADYMELALSHPDYGYYRQSRPIGKQGDFITAPEISQIFGELLGVWVAATWQAMGRPSPFTLMECGPGRGTLMQDALRSLSRILPDIFPAMQLLLVDIHPQLIAQQRTAISGFSLTPQWQECVQPLPEMPCILLANEFLDALPIEQYIRQAGAWHARQVTYDADDSLIFTHSIEASSPPSAPPEAQEGDIYETCPAAHRIIHELAGHAAQHPLAALFIDYGHADYGWGDSLQAVKAHQPCSLFETPGEADLTAHVDFARLADTARAAGAAVHGPVTQGRFLSDMGIATRLQSLLQKATPEQQQGMMQSAHRLTAPESMGELFKLMALSSPALNSLPALPNAA